MRNCLFFSVCNTNICRITEVSGLLRKKKFMEKYRHQVMLLYAHSENTEILDCLWFT